MRLIVILIKGRYSLYKLMKRRRIFALLDKARSVYDGAYSKHEIDYLGSQLFN